MYFISPNANTKSATFSLNFTCTYIDSFPKLLLPLSFTYLMMSFRRLRWENLLLVILSVWTIVSPLVSAALNENEIKRIKHQHATQKYLIRECIKKYVQKERDKVRAYLLFQLIPFSEGTSY
jgi:hypothetical protein